MTDLWDAATRDLNDERLVASHTAARVASVDLWAGVLSTATSRDDFENRLAAIGPTLDGICETLAPGDPSMFLQVRAELDRTLAEDFSQVFASRQQAAQKTAGSPRDPDPTDEFQPGDEVVIIGGFEDGMTGKIQSPAWYEDTVYGNGPQKAWYVDCYGTRMGPYRQGNIILLSDYNARGGAAWLKGSSKMAGVDIPTCPECGSSNVLDLSDAFSAHSEKYKCEDCGDRFNKDSDLPTKTSVEWAPGACPGSREPLPDQSAKYGDLQACPVCGKQVPSQPSHETGGPTVVRAWDHFPDKVSHRTASARYDLAKDVVDNGIYDDKGKTKKLEGAILDGFTAGAMVKVYEALSPENQAKFDSIPLDKLIDFVWSKVSSVVAADESNTYENYVASFIAQGMTPMSKSDWERAKKNSEWNGELDPAWASKTAGESYLQGDWDTEGEAQEYADLWNESEPWGGNATYVPEQRGNGRWSLRATMASKTASGDYCPKCGASEWTMQPSGTVKCDSCSHEFLISQAVSEKPKTTAADENWCYGHSGHRVFKEGGPVVICDECGKEFKDANNTGALPRHEQPKDMPSTASRRESARWSEGWMRGFEAGRLAARSGLRSLAKFESKGAAESEGFRLGVQAVNHMGEFRGVPKSATITPAYAWQHHIATRKVAYGVACPNCAYYGMIYCRETVGKCDRCGQEADVDMDYSESGDRERPNQTLCLDCLSLPDVHFDAAHKPDALAEYETFVSSRKALVASCSLCATAGHASDCLLREPPPFAREADQTVELDVTEVSPELGDRVVDAVETVVADEPGDVGVAVTSMAAQMFSSKTAYFEEDAFNEAVVQGLMSGRSEYINPGAMLPSAVYVVNQPGPNGAIPTDRKTTDRDEANRWAQELLAQYPQGFTNGARSSKTAADPFGKDNPFGDANPMGPTGGEPPPESNAAPMPEVMPMTSKPRTIPGGGSDGGAPQDPPPAGEPQEKAQAVARVVQGIRQTNPGMGEAEATQLATATVERYPSMVKAVLIQ